VLTHIDTLKSATSLALNLWELGHYELARQLGEDTLTRTRQLARQQPPQHPARGHQPRRYPGEPGKQDQARCPEL
jgi:hypothetical protein